MDVKLNQKKEIKIKKIIKTNRNGCCSTNPKYSIFPFFKFLVNDVSARLSKEKYFLNIQDVPKAEPLLNSA